VQALSTSSATNETSPLPGTFALWHAIDSGAPLEAEAVAVRVAALAERDVSAAGVADLACVAEVLARLGGAPCLPLEGYFKKLLARDAVAPLRGTWAPADVRHLVVAVGSGRHALSTDLARGALRRASSSLPMLWRARRPPRVGRSRAVLDACRAALQLEEPPPSGGDVGERVAAAPLSLCVRRSLEDTKASYIAEALDMLVYRLEDIAPFVATLAALGQPEDLESAPWDVLGTHLDALTSVDGVLAGAFGALPPSATPAPDDVVERRAHVLRARPALWPAVFANRVLTLVAPVPTDLQRMRTDAAFANAAEGVQQSRDVALARAQRGSSITRQRAGCVEATALAAALFEAALRDDVVAGPRPLEGLPALLEHAGRAQLAKHSMARNTFLTSLFTLVAFAARVPRADVAHRERALALFAAVLAMAPEVFARESAALVADIQRAHPSGNARAALIADVVDGRRGGPGLVRLVEQLTNAFHEGVESDSLRRLTDAMHSGALQLCARPLCTRRASRAWAKRSSRRSSLPTCMARRSTSRRSGARRSCRPSPSSRARSSSTATTLVIGCAPSTT
jgi:hypothetical protein